MYVLKPYIGIKSGFTQNVSFYSQLNARCKLLNVNCLKITQTFRGRNNNFGVDHRILLFFSFELQGSKGQEATGCCNRFYNVFWWSLANQEILVFRKCWKWHIIDFMTGESGTVEIWTWGTFGPVPHFGHVCPKMQLLLPMSLHEPDKPAPV